MNQPRPNIPQHNPMDSLPPLGTPVNLAAQTKTNTQAVDHESKDQAQAPIGVPDFYKNRLDVPQAQAPTFTAPSSSQPFVPAQSPQYAQQAPVQDPRHQFTFEAPEVPQPQEYHAQPHVNAVQPPVPGQFPGSVQMPQAGVPTQHPVVNSLLRDLGFSEAQLETVEYKGHSFTMRKNPAELFAYVLSVVSKSSSTNDERMVRLTLTLPAVSVVFIDGVPSWKVLEVNVSTLGNFDDSNPPYRVAVKVAPKLIDLFIGNKLDIDVITELADRYEKKWSTTDPEIELAAKAADITKDDKRVRFSCSVPGCTETDDAVPEFIDATNVKIRYCHEHGPTMSPLGYLKDLANSPLA